MAVAQLVRASGCGPEGRGFKSHQPPHFSCSMPEFDEPVDPEAICLEDRQLCKARLFVEGDELLGVLATDSQDVAVEKIARMMTALEIELFLQDGGQARLKALDLSIVGIVHKTIVVLGTKKDRSVINEAFVMDTEAANEIMGYE